MLLYSISESETVKVVTKALREISTLNAHANTSRRRGGIAKRLALRIARDYFAAGAQVRARSPAA